jgi:hypothetical protein
MATVYVDNKPYQMNPDQNLLHGCLSLGLQAAVFLLASGAGIGGRLPPVRRQTVQRRARRARQDRDVLHDAGQAEGTRISIDDPKRPPSAPALSRDSC